MIAVRLIGGLGNQLFQYSAGRALSLERNCDLLLDRSWFDSAHGATPREYALGQYPIEARAFDGSKVRASAGIVARLTKRDAPVRSLLADAGWKVVKPAGRVYDSSLLRGSASRLYMDGYWQSERYFVAARDVLRRELTPREPLRARGVEFTSAPVIAVHVRRGDYVNDARANAYHGVCSLDYYRRALAYVQQREPQARPVVFSDEPAWAREHFADWRGVHFVDPNEQRPELDLQLMRSCQHFIIANSSFSWWAAWLATGPDKIVVAPRQWFADPTQNEGDLVPSHWVRL